jgi:phosphoribosylformylglycinamidine synthase
MKRFGVVIFPGSNCDADVYHAVRDLVGVPAEYIWHEQRDLAGVDCVILPGGFSYGDYLRAGAIARFSPVMEAVAEHARKGGLVLGICNGFQILLEAGLLPGAMLRNSHQRFACKYVHVRVENARTIFTRAARPGAVWRIPIAHGEGNYFASPETISQLERNGQIVLRYCDARGDATPEANPNGSVGNIAGICNEEGNILGMMPHPERCCDPILGSSDGRLIFESILGAPVGAAGVG